MPERYELLNKATGEVIFTLDENPLAPKFCLVTGDVPSVVNREIAAKYDLE